MAAGTIRPRLVKAIGCDVVVMCSVYFSGITRWEFLQDSRGFPNSLQIMYIGGGDDWSATILGASVW